MNVPSWYAYTKNAAAINKITNENMGEVRYEGYREYFTHKFSINGVTYLMRTAPNNPNERYIGVPLSALKPVDDGYVPLLKLRSMRVKNSVNKINSETMDITGPVIAEGSEISFGSKIYINEEIYLRSSHDTKLGYNKAIPYSSLEEL